KFGEVDDWNGHSIKFCERVLKIRKIKNSATGGLSGRTDISGLPAVCYFFPGAYRPQSKLRLLRSPRECNHTADIGHPRNKKHHPLEPQPEAGMRHRPKTPGIEIPPQ